ncbi:MAG: type III pantothenate kinase [Methylococcaceae bacterium]|nr:type III pantothenate kinase [Methylococcaceae bacterium]
MTKMLVDIGNTRIKWGLANGQVINSGHPIVHKQLSQNELFDSWKNISPPDSLAISCVSTIKLLELVKSVANKLWPNIVIFLAKSKSKAFGVSNAYIDPERLGVDRWLSLLAARRHYPGNTCIVDCGTAITIDVMDAEGRHQGGVISPGLSLMKNSLAQGTDALRFDQNHYPVGLAQSTDAAIHTGTIWSATGLIEHAFNQQEENATLILTGGDAELIAEQLVCKPIVDVDLVLRGLAIMSTGQT